MKQDQAVRTTNQRNNGNGSGRLRAKSTESQQTNGAAHPEVRNGAASDLGGSTNGPETDGSDVDVLIAERAYSIYLSRGGQDGDAISDWLEAERQVRGNAATSH